MAKTKPVGAAKKAVQSADAFIAGLDHPLKADIELVRKAILRADTSIADGVKWNSLSFRTIEWFATINLRSRDRLQLVLHLGAKTGKSAGGIEDPEGLLEWLGKDRALATLGVGPQVKARLPALTSIVRTWVSQVTKTDAPPVQPERGALKRPSTGAAR